MISFVFLVSVLVNGVLDIHRITLQATSDECRQEMLMLAAVNQAHQQHGSNQVFFGECRTAP